MFGDILNWYLSTVSEFWGSFLRIGIPQVLLLVLVFFWLCGPGCGRRCFGSSGWFGRWCCKESCCRENERHRRAEKEEKGAECCGESSCEADGGGAGDDGGDEEDAAAG